MATTDLTKIGNTLGFVLPTTPTTLTSTNTKATPSVNLTPPPDNNNYAGMIGGAVQQAQTYTIPSGAQVDAQGNMVSQGQNQTSQQTPQNNTFDIKSYVDSIMGVEQPNATQTYGQDYKNSQLPGLQADVNAKAQITSEAQGRLNNISAQLQALNTEATAIPLQNEQNAIGQTGMFGVQSANARQLRDVALRALPLQAQAAVIQAEVATAQGNQRLAQDLYTQAEQHFDKVFQLQMQDAQNKYQFQTNLINKVYDLADKQEQRQLDALKTQKAQDFQTQQDELKFQRDKEIAAIKASSSTGGGVLSGLPVSIQGKVINAAQSFGTSDIVKKFNSVVDSINVVNGISANSTNPADHQAIVYAFAKALDPDSAVREGEYATIKKYAQSAVDRYGKEISNALNGTGFLSAGAIKNIQSTMNQLYTSRKPQYDNAYSERARTLNNIAGADVAGELLTDYSQGVSNINMTNTQDDIYNSVVGGVESSSWMTNLWNNLFKI